MKTLLKKEMKLSAPLITYLFIAGALLTMTPGYPILVGTFFVCFGVFQFFQTGREANDTLYTAMLPVEKADVVRAKYAFTLFIQLSGFVIMVLLTAVRMAFLADATPFVNNAMMNANPAYLGYALMIFAAFNTLFVGGFFKTAYKIGRPFLFFGIAAFFIVGVGEALHFVPALRALNDTRYAPIQLIPLAIGMLAFLILTPVAKAAAIKRFNQIDL